MKYLLFLIFIIILIPTLFAGTRHQSVSDQSLLHNSDNYKCIVQIWIDKPDGRYKASGVLISKDAILTSGHILYGEKIDSEKITVIYLTKQFKATSYIIHKDFKYHSDNDLAIIKIFGFIDETYPELYDKSDEIGKLAYLGGYGATGTGETGYNNWDFQLRIGTNIIEYIHGDLLMCTMSRNNFTKYEFITCPGDSGGGLFIDKKLAGINSSLFSDKKDVKPTGKYNHTSGHTRISNHLEWIKNSIY